MNKLLTILLLCLSINCQAQFDFTDQAFITSSSHRANLFPSMDSLLTGLVSYWKLDEASGTRYDSWGTNHLTDVNSTASTTGILNLSGVFSATKYIQKSPAINITAKSDFTACAWFYKTNYAGSIETLFAKYTTAFSTLDFDLRISNVGKLDAYVNSANITDSRVIPTNAWVFATLMRSGNTMSIWTNGVLAVSGACSNTNYIDAPFRIGAGTGGGESFNGLIDEVPFWNRALSTNEIQFLYNSGKARYLPFNLGP